MELEYDQNKKDETFRERGLDFDDAVILFSGIYFTSPDDRKDYGEARNISVGMIGDDVVAVVWTARGTRRRIISMRKANSNERGEYQHALDRPG